MKSSLIAKLEQMVERREEVARELGDPVVIGDADRFRRLSQEYAQLGPVVESYAAWREVGTSLEGLEQMRTDPDPELRGMAEDELPQLQARLEALQEELQTHLVPRDPLDGNNVFLEIRAGTGGDEAAIFAGDLFRMYSRYAELQGWQVEVLSACLLYTSPSPRD